MIVQKLIVPFLLFIKITFSYGQESEIKVEYGSPVPVIPEGLRISTFDLDATPPVGSQLAYDPELNDWDLGLRAKGVVILGAGQPVVLCSVDWLYISNAANEAFRNALAQAIMLHIPRVITVQGLPTPISRVLHDSSDSWKYPMPFIFISTGQEVI